LAGYAGISGRVSPELVAGFGPEYLNILISRFPNRKEPIMAAFRGHKTEEYFLSIPVFLSQSEGIAKELSSYSPFNKKDKKPAISRYLEKNAAKDLNYLLLSPLHKESLINTSNILNSKSNSFNRHEIMHGTCNNYGTLINSFKAISFLYYIGEILYSNNLYSNKLSKISP
jgi:hypothetical protein